MMLLAFLLSVAPVVTPVSSSALRDGGTAVVVRGQGSFSVTPSDYNGTLFGRQRVAASYNLVDIINTYGFDTEVWGSRGDGGITSLANEAARLRIRCSARTHASSLTSATGQTDPRGMAPHRPV